MENKKLVLEGDEAFKFVLRAINLSISEAKVAASALMVNLRGNWVDNYGWRLLWLAFILEDLIEKDPENAQSYKHDLFLVAQQLRIVGGEEQDEDFPFFDPSIPDGRVFRDAFLYSYQHTHPTTDKTKNFLEKILIDEN